MNAEERKERKRQLGRKYYGTMTDQQREHRKAYQRTYMRKRRSALREQAAAVGASASLAEPLQTAPAPVTLPTAGKPAVANPSKSAQPAARAQDLASYDDVSAPKARNLQRVWRKEVSEYLLDVLTAPESPLTGAGFRGSQMICFWFKLSEKLDRIVEQEKPEMTEEFTLAVLLEGLRRLTGEKKTGSPVLP